MVAYSAGFVLFCKNWSMNNELKWEKWAKSLAGEASEKEVGEIEADIRANNMLAAEFNHAQEDWDNATYAARYNAIDGEAAYSKVLSKIGKPISGKRRVVGYYLAAASLLAMVAVGLTLWLSLGHGNTAAYMNLASATSGVLSLQLSDGSQVALNKGSDLRYPVLFGDRERLVHLQGEAFFNVAANKSKPFVISAGEVSIRVVGTSFNVRSKTNEQTVEVTVRDGVVEVIGKADKVQLTKGQVAVFNESTGLISKSENINVNYNAWLSKELVFSEMPLSDAFNVLENVYHIKFNVRNPQLLNLKWTAAFKQQDADFIAQSLALTFNLKVTKTNDSFMFD
jgi:transmembrane sensor